MAASSAAAVVAPIFNNSRRLTFAEAMGSFIRLFTASAGLEEKWNQNTATVNHRTSPPAGTTVTFPDSSNRETVACEKMMLPGPGRVNTDRDSVLHPWSWRILPSIGLRGKPSAHHPNQFRRQEVQFLRDCRQRCGSGYFQFVLSATGAHLDENRTKVAAPGRNRWDLQHGQGVLAGYLIESFSGATTDHIRRLAEAF